MSQSELTPIMQIQSRVKYYLLDWRDRNMDEYIKMYGGRKMNSLTFDELHHLFSLATTIDSAEITKTTTK